MKKKRYRPVSYRTRTTKEKELWNRKSQELLAHAEDIWKTSDFFDTAVRDSIAQGLAHIVNAAYDCAAVVMEFPDLASWSAFIDNSTARWFQDRGFAEWFCGAASTLFRTTPPRRLNASLVLKVKKSVPRQRRRK